MFESSTPRWFAMNTFSVVIRLVRVGVHTCGNVYCKTSKDYYPSGHQCYMLPVDYNDRQKKQTYIFFDFECTQDDMIQCQQGYQLDDNEKCIHCGARWVFQGRRLVVEIKACWSFELSSTILTMYPIIFSLIVNLSTIMAYVVASVFFFGIITFVTVCRTNEWEIIPVETSIVRLVKIIIHLNTSVLQR
jgi:hypothetical protein